MWCLFGAFGVRADLVILDLDALLGGDSEAVFPTKVYSTDFEAATVVPGHLDLINADPVHEIPNTIRILVELSNLIHAPDLSIYHLALVVHEFEGLSHLARFVPAQIEPINDHTIRRGHRDLISRVHFDLSIELRIQLVSDFEGHARQEINHVSAAEVL